MQLQVEDAVRDRYARGAREREERLCCPTDYDERYLSVLPPEIIERDYGCGDPSAYVREGDTVLDLGSGGGKICYIAAQIAGPSGRVIGVDVIGPCKSNRNLPMVRKPVFSGMAAAALSYSFCKDQ